MDNTYVWEHESRGKLDRYIYMGIEVYITRTRIEKEGIYVYTCVNMSRRYVYTSMSTGRRYIYIYINTSRRCMHTNARDDERYT